MKRMNDIYDRIQMDHSALERAITAAENTARGNRFDKIPLAVGACAAALALGIGTLWLFRPVDQPAAGRTADITYETAARFSGYGSADDSLQAHDGVAMWIDGAYYNGKTMAVAIRGDYERYDRNYAAPPDMMKYTSCEGDGAGFFVNGQEVRPLSDELELTKHGRFFEGVLELETDVDESIVQLEIHLPGIEILSGEETVKTVREDIAMTNVIPRIYTSDEETLLSGGNVIYLSCNAEAPGAIGDAPVGLNIAYYVPDGMDVRAKAFNADGSEIDLVRSVSHAKADGKMFGDQFGSADGRRIGIVLYDANTGEVLFVQSAYLNDPYVSFAMDD